MNRSNVAPLVGNSRDVSLQKMKCNYHHACLTWTLSNTFPHLNLIIALTSAEVRPCEVLLTFFGSQVRHTHADRSRRISSSSGVQSAAPLLPVSRGWTCCLTPFYSGNKWAQGVEEVSKSQKEKKKPTLIRLRLCCFLSSQSSAERIWKESKPENKSSNYSNQKTEVVTVAIPSCFS